MRGCVAVAAEPHRWCHLNSVFAATPKGGEVAVSQSDPGVKKWKDMVSGLTDDEAVDCWFPEAMEQAQQRLRGLACVPSTLLVCKKGQHRHWLRSASRRSPQMLLVTENRLASAVTAALAAFGNVVTPPLAPRCACGLLTPAPALALNRREVHNQGVGESAPACPYPPVIDG